MSATDELRILRVKVKAQAYELERLRAELKAVYGHGGDLVEVVRCRDCSYCQRHVDGSHVCELTHLAHRADYYCYYGARREVEE